MSHPTPPERLSQPVDVDVARAVDSLTVDQREFYEERASILCFDAHMPIAQAEREALRLTRKYFGLAG